ncbi:hypothetical protein BH10PSE7_BH10PSE7_14220 [soil metagenome]
MRLAILVALLVMAFAGSARAASDLTDGVAITDPETLKILERDYGLGLAPLLQQRVMPKAAFAPVKMHSITNNDALFRIPALSPITRFVKAEIIAQRTLSLEPLVRANRSVARFFFNPDFIDAAGSRLVLTGVINRMDRAFLSQHPCGEIRLVYRFHYTLNIPKKKTLTSRLPLTLSLIFDAKPPGETSCAEIARRWLDTAGHKLPPAEQAQWLHGVAGPLSPDLLGSRQIIRVELNMQVLRLPAAVKKDFGGHAEYLMKQFRWDGRIFQDSLMENQPDRERLLADPALLRDLKAFLSEPASVYDLDRGRLILAQRFLVDRAVSVAPGGLARSQNNPYTDLLSDKDIVAALSTFAATGGALRTIKSVAGFRARLNDMTCSGCHQTHAIAGFHYTGADSADEIDQNAVFVPGSAHFFGDLPRRRAIVEAFAAGRPPDFTRPFAGRPGAAFAPQLAGTDLFNGWGAVCYNGNDQTFATWTCGDGLKCAALHASPLHEGFGTCMSAAGNKVGDPVEFGTVKMTRFGNDSYCRTSPATLAACRIAPDRDPRPALPDKSGRWRAARQRWDTASAQTGGFPAGMLRLGGCEGLPAEATCGRVARQGFNDCVADPKKTYRECLSERTALSGLRACDAGHPCREDYICTARNSDLPAAKPGKGTCIPPYFVFQFRVDGHPSSWQAP